MITNLKNKIKLWKFRNNKNFYIKTYGTSKASDNQLIGLYELLASLPYDFGWTGSRSKEDNAHGSFTQPSAGALMRATQEDRNTWRECLVRSAELKVSVFVVGPAL